MSGAQQAGKARHVDVAAAKQHTDAFSLELVFHFSGRRETQAACGFHNKLHASRHECHAVDEFCVL